MNGIVPIPLDLYLKVIRIENLRHMVLSVRLLYDLLRSKPEAAGRRLLLLSIFICLCCQIIRPVLQRHVTDTVGYHRHFPFFHRLFRGPFGGFLRTSSQSNGQNQHCKNHSEISCHPYSPCLPQSDFPILSLSYHKRTGISLR